MLQKKKGNMVRKPQGGLVLGQISLIWYKTQGQQPPAVTVFTLLHFSKSNHTCISKNGKSNKHGFYSFMPLKLEYRLKCAKVKSSSFPIMKQYIDDFAKKIKKFFNRFDNKYVTLT